MKLLLRWPGLSTFKNHKHPEKIVKESYYECKILSNPILSIQLGRIVITMIFMKVISKNI